ncbi:MAG: hypothetical protein JNM34_07650 [Chthonomonadaceae bacterium]|nr:hypothetical protein [Chthonomonadaceae bacterium]
MRLIFGLTALLVSCSAFSQDNLPQMLGALEPRELGPTTMGGRITSMAVYNKDPRVFYVGTASGGVWKTENAGRTMTPIFDKMPTLSVGAVAINQKNPDDVWVGTGEATSRNSTCIGEGLYRSTDGGKSWTYVAFKETKQFSRIAIDPSNPDVVFVGALGNLWGPNPERGLYKTADGGKTWKKVIDKGPKVGIVDVVINPKNPKIVIAATWERLRVPYNFYSRSVENGIYRSTDGGEHFTKVSRGVPTGEVGRIGLSVMESNPRIWMATIDHKDGGTFRSTDGGESWTNMGKANPRPFYFSLPIQDPLDEKRVYLGGTTFQSSDDMGKTFRDLPGMNVHPDYHAVWVNPADNNQILVGNDGGVAQSRDRGKTWEFLGTMRIGQFYDVSVNMKRPYWVFGGAQDNGSWGGPTQTRNGGVAYYHWISVGGGDGFYVEADPEDSQIIYTESQGGALQRINIDTGESRFIQPRPQALGEPANTRYRFNWNSPIMISPHNHTTLYFGGNKLFKSVNRGNDWKAVSPDLTTNDPEKLKPVVGDAVNSGAEMHCTIISISESPIKQGVLWVGTDDGLVQVSQDDGTTWTNVTPNFANVPKGTWVSRVDASGFKVGRCYVTFDGHRNNDYKPYVYMTDDFGATWTELKGIPAGHSCYVIKEGLRNEDLLFVGTEFGLFVSIDRGATWSKYTTGTFPNVRIDDVEIHPRELDLVIGTHGRSFWSVNVSALEQLNKSARDKDTVLCEPQDVVNIGRLSGGGYTGFGEFMARNTQPGTTVFYWLKAETKEKVVVSVVDVRGNEVARLDGKGGAGLNSVSWTPRGGGGGRRGGGGAQPGAQPANRTSDYSVILKIGDKEVARSGVRVEFLIPANPSGGGGVEGTELNDEG